MTYAKISEIIKEKQPADTLVFLEKTYELLKDGTHELSFIERNRIYNIAINKAYEAAKQGARTEFVCATILFDLVEQNLSLIPKIKSLVNENVATFAHCYVLAKQKLKEPSQLEHSYRTALRLATIKINFPAICAAMLHELPVHSETSIEEITKIFGTEIGILVNKFLNIRVIKTANSSQYINHLREMIVAMAKDLRVIIIKMCSNIDRMEGYSSAYSNDKLFAIATESMEILAPLANVLGIWELRWRLEDLSFKILQPEEYKKINQRFNEDEQKNRAKYIQKMIVLIGKEAKSKQIKCQIEGRFKHFYSIYQKIKNKKKAFSEICDVFALRIIVSNIDDCYRMMGAIHQLWRPKKRRIKDYIAAPKSNNYRSLHTTVFGMNGRPTEFQIRTKEMDDIANFGIAAHWYYKNPKTKTPNWMQELLLQQQQYKDDEEFLDAFSSSILQDRIYVYSPKGDVIALPSKATPVDFAFAIHTEVGNKCSSAIVNDSPVPLDTQLATNDVIEITLNRDQAGPKAEWLTFVQTNNAKKHIQEYLDQFPVERSFRL
ncbi:MAG: (P)ppGpp synthetase I, SpoT/RelA [Parcubacteria group bacterium GW2011_GWC2_38_7]|nr:MAG: (P)ppGpp synthetase I, SpoT/RelA [Parcubacteria group bacterium GW2011_GWC2_38_7]